MTPRERNRGIQLRGERKKVKSVAKQVPPMNHVQRRNQQLTADLN